MTDYFNSSYNNDRDKRVSEVITNRIHNEFNDIFCGIVCSQGTFPLQVKEGSCLYKAPSRREFYALQKPLKEELE